MVIIVSLHHHTIFGERLRLLLVSKGPDKMRCGSAGLPTALWLVESGLQIVAVVSDVAASQRDA